jgi:Transposase DDE domain
MYLKCSKRRKNGKEHRSWSIVENRRVEGGCVQRHVLYLGEINDSQQAAWQKSIEVFTEGESEPRQVALFPEDRVGAASTVPQIQVKLQALSLHRPRQWGACWLALELWRELGLDEFWRARLAESRKGTRWDLVLTTLAIYRWLDPGSEWRLHREWFERSALGDLLGGDYRLAADDTLYRCHDRLLAHKAALFSHLQERWRDLFNARFDVLLYDLTSTYFESDPPESKEGLRRFGYSRDKRSDCVQVVIALIVTPEGFPLGYEVLSGNTADNTTLQGMLAKIETQYGKAERTWLMDRGIPTEDVLEEMRRSTPPGRYLVGTPKGRLSKLEGELAKLPWQQARPGVEVKLLPQDGELYVFAQSVDRIAKERSMRRRRLKKLWARLQVLQAQKLTYNELLMKLGAAKAEAGQCWRAVEIILPEPPATAPLSKTAGRPKKAQKAPRAKAEAVTFTFTLERQQLRQMYRREGRYLLRSNLTGTDPAALWQHYITLTQIEEAFKSLKGDLGVRPIFHQKDDRIEAHIFVAFLAYCLHVTLGRRLHALAPGLSARAVLAKFAAISLLDVQLPTTDDRILRLTRHTEPDQETQLLLAKLQLKLPPQPPPKITAPSAK